MTCMLIDDDPDEIEIFSFALEKLPGPLCLKAYTDFDKALGELLSSGEIPDYIFLDGFMRPITGKEALGRLRSYEQLRTIPVIIYSGFVNDDMKNDLLALGASDVLEKPHSVDSLRESLAQLFGTGSGTSL